MRIGNIETDSRLVLAPMAGATDAAFRRICREQGAGITVTEMVSSKALMMQDRKSLLLMTLSEGESPAAVQIFGSDTVCMGEAAAKVCAISRCDFIDINMGCPMKKIVCAGDGSALMRKPELAGRIIEAVVKNSDRPVTVKFRKGFDSASVNAVEFAGICQSAGAAAVAVHGRTTAQKYSGHADWDIIGEVKAAVSVPVVANGDVFSPEDAVKILRRTGADAVMIGRGALGYPWLFREAKAALEGRDIPASPTYSERIRTAVRQTRMASENLGERTACLEARKHLAWYLKGMPRAAFFRTQIMTVSTLSELASLERDILDFLRDEERRRSCDC